MNTMTHVLVQSTIHKIGFRVHTSYPNSNTLVMTCKLMDMIIQFKFSSMFLNYKIFIICVFPFYHMYIFIYSLGLISLFVPILRGKSQLCPSLFKFFNVIPSFF